MPRTMKLLLLPGLDGTEIFFKPLVTALPKWIKPLVITYSPSPANDYPNLLSVVRDAIGDRKAFYVLGWSFSAPLALILATAEPNRVRGVILCASFIRPPHPLLRSVRFAMAPPLVHLLRITHRLHSLCSKEFPRSTCRGKAGTLCRVPSRIIGSYA
jgi:pimeloyl-ACP methyl ester carboxylesterase